MFLPASKKTTYLQLALVVFIVLTVFALVVNGGLLKWDDFQLLIEDSNLKDLSLESFFALWSRVHDRLYIPAVQSVWFMMGLVFGQWNLAALHAVNLALHAANSVLVFFILRRLLPRDRDFSGWIATLATLLFALHPTRVEAVAWIAGLKEVLAATFGFSSLLLYLAARETNSRAKRFASVVLLALSFTAKPSFMMLPLCLVVLEFTGAGVSEWRKIAKLTWPYFALALVIGAVTSMTQEPHALLYVPPLWARPLVALDAVGFYLGKIVVPIGLAPDYGRMPGLLLERPEVLWMTLPLVAVVIALLAWLKNRDVTKTALLFVISLLPLLGLQPFFFQQISTVADRYLYFPALWVSLIFALGLGALGRRVVLQKVAIAVSVLYLVACSCVVVTTIPKWRDDVTFFTWMLERNPSSFNAINRLADYEREAGRLQNALDLYEASHKVAPWQPYPWLYSAYVKWQLGRRDESIATLRELLVTYPGYEPAQQNLERLLKEK